MKANTSIETTGQIITQSTTGFDGSETRLPDTGQAGPQQNGAKEQGKGKTESELRAAARRKGLTLKELADKMGVSYGYLSQVSAGSRPWFPMLRERATAVLGEVPGQGDGFQRQGSGAPRGSVRQLHDPGVPGPKEHEPRGPGQGGGRAGRSREGGSRPMSHR